MPRMTLSKETLKSAKLFKTSSGRTCGYEHPFTSDWKYSYSWREKPVSSPEDVFIGDHCHVSSCISDVTHCPVAVRIFADIPRLILKKFKFMSKGSMERRCASCVRAYLFWGLWRSWKKTQLGKQCVDTWNVLWHQTVFAAQFLFE